MGELTDLAAELVVLRRKVKEYENLIRMLTLDLVACSSYVNNENLIIRVDESLEKANALLPEA